MKKASPLFSLLLGIGVSAIVIACATDTPVQEATETVINVVTESPDTRPMDVQQMESALGVDAFHKAAGVQYKLNLIFGGKPRFKGTIVQTSSMDRIHLTQEGEEMVFDGEQVHVQTAGELNTRSARFNALTWPYFFALPFKLDDPGTSLETLKNHTVEGIEYRRAKLTFGAGIGDAPDDWYILYFDEEDRLAAAAYIVTFGGKSQADALANAHLIRYHDYEQSDGVWFSRKWTFHDWSEAEGWTKQIGEAGVYDISLLTVLSADEFKIPAGAIATGAPQ